MSDSRLTAGMFADLALDDVLPGISRATVQGSQMTVVRYVYQPGSVFPRHSHPEEQLTYIISGRILFEIDGVERSLGPGEYGIIPSGMPHGARVVEDEVVETINVMSPRRTSAPQV